MVNFVEVLTEGRVMCINPTQVVGVERGKNDRSLVYLSDGQLIPVDEPVQSVINRLEKFMPGTPETIFASTKRPGT